MLPRKNKLKKKTDFKKVFDQGKYCGSSFIGLKALKNDLGYSRFGVIVGSKISKKAVERNKIKRRIENSVSGAKEGWDIVIMVKPPILQKTFAEIKEQLSSLFKKLWVY